MSIEPDGPRDASVVILGEAPGSYDIQEGISFCGPGGNLLWGQVLSQAGLTRAMCLTLNTYWEQPPGNELSKARNPTEYWEQTRAVIASHPRKVIVAVGSAALQFLTGHESITKWRGSILRSEEYNCWIFPMLHPSVVLRSYDLLFYAKRDAGKLKWLLTQDSITQPEREIVQTYEGLRRFNNDCNATVDWMLKELDSYLDAPCITFDIETYARTVTIIGLAKSSNHAVVVPLIGDFPWNRTTELVRKVQAVLESQSLKIGQNLDYDVQYLAQTLNIGVRNVWLDTMVAHSVMWPELSHSLDTLVSLYTIHPYYKDMRKETKQSSYGETAYIYNGLDCCLTYEVGMALANEMLSTKTWHFFHAIAMPVTKTLVRMEHRGVLVDHELRNKRKAELEKDLELAIMAPELEGVNPNSPKQVKAWFAARGITPKSMGKETSDSHALKILHNKREDLRSFIDAVLRVRDLRKIISTYLSAECSPDGRMRTTYRTSATDTGRISSSSDVFGDGMNLQNVPIDQRDWFIPDPGKVFWEVDLSQAEARNTAWISGDIGYVEAFLDPTKDLHTENAMALFGIPRERAGKERTPQTMIKGSQYNFRDVGKRASHAINYKIGPRKLKELMNEYVPNLPFTENTAKEFISRFIKLRPGVANWWDRVIKHLHKNRTIYNMWGRRRVFLDRLDEQCYRKAVAFLPQSTTADHLNYSLVRIEQRLEREVPSASLFLQVHDAIAGQCAENDLALVSAIVCEELEKPIPIEVNGHKCIVPADFHSGPNWGACK